MLKISKIQKNLGSVLMLIVVGVISYVVLQRNSMPGNAPSSNSDHTIQTITAEKGKQLMEEETIILVDVRTAQEYAKGHIPEAILIPNETISEEPPLELVDFSASIIVYCRSGHRSAEAAAKLSAMGYQNIYDMGGIQDWPYDIVL